MPRIPKSEKKKNGKKKRSAMKTAAAIVAVLLIAFVSFAVFGDDIVPEKVRSLKAYSYVAAMVRDKVPDEIELPFGLKVELPVDLPEVAVTLPFGLDERLSGLKERFSGLPLLGFLGDGDGEPADKKHGEAGDSDEENTVILAEQAVVREGNAAGQEGKAAKQEGAGSETKGNNPAETVNGAESKPAVSRSEEEIKLISAGADNSIVLNNYNIYEDIPADWIRCDLKIIEHRTDVNAGTDTVVIYLELENNIVNMIGTKEITYRYNERTGNWEPESATKISCLAIEPVTAEL